MHFNFIAPLDFFIYLHYLVLQQLIFIRKLGPLVHYLQ